MSMKHEDDTVFKLTILKPVIEYLDVFTNTSHNLSSDEFLKAIYDPEEEFVDGKKTCGVEPQKILPKTLQTPPVPLQKPIARLFFEIIRLRPFLLSVVKEYRRRRSRRVPIKVSQTIVITYALIYRSSAESTSDAINCLIHFNASKMLALMSFFLTPELDSWFYITGCDVYDVEFVEQKILVPFIKALPIIQSICTSLSGTRRKKPAPKKTTIPIQMNVLKHPKRLPDPPVCTRENVPKVLVQPVPKTLYKVPDIESKIATLREEHRVQAAQRLEDAKAKAPACFDAKKSKRYQRVLEEINDIKMKRRVPIVATKIPNFKNVSVKKTVTTILREGALIASCETKEVERLKELLKGSFDPAEVQRMEDETRLWEKEENLRNIEEKHLSGLISYEESLLAKQQLIEEAKEQGDRVRAEREELNAKLEKYRLEETGRLRRIVEKHHDAEQAAKEAYASMVDEKRQKAAEVAEESRRIKLRLIKQNEEELRRKLQMIQAIKTLQALGGLRAKEFDPTETAQLGLMCEMSLAELRERLFRAKGEWQDELIARREAVKDRRQKKKDLVNCVQKTIDEYRRVTQPSSTALLKPTAGDLYSKIHKTPKLEALRRKLEERRTSRCRKMHSESTNVIFKSDEKSAQRSALMTDGIYDNSKN